MNKIKNLKGINYNEENSNHSWIWCKKSL
jgi:hypothetical protein